MTNDNRDALRERVKAELVRWWIHGGEEYDAETDRILAMIPREPPPAASTTTFSLDELHTFGNLLRVHYGSALLNAQERHCTAELMGKVAAAVADRAEEVRRRARVPPPIFSAYAREVALGMSDAELDQALQNALDWAQWGRPGWEGQMGLVTLRVVRELARRARGKSDRETVGWYNCAEGDP
jgi:hypothetical protein